MSEHRITAVRLTPVATPRRSGLVCGHVIVELVTESGIVGVGEMSDFQHLPRFHVDVVDLQATLEALLVGLDPSEANELSRRIDEAFPSAGNLYDKASVIACGIDIALWDVRGKIAGRSVSELLGGRVRDALPVAYPIFRQQHPDDVGHNLDVVAERLDEGFALFRVYVGRDTDLDERFLRAMRERFGDRVSIKSLDFSNLLDPVAAARFIERTRDVGYDLVEAPAPAHDLDGLAFVRQRTLVPVSEHVYDARTALELVARSAVDVLNVGLFAVGGITRALRVMAVAEAAGVACLVGTTQELAIGTAAAAHFGAASPSVTQPSDPVGPLLYVNDVVRESVRYEAGQLLVPHGPGLGVELDTELLARAAAPLTWGAASTASIIDRVGVPS